MAGPPPEDRLPRGAVRAAHRAVVRRALADSRRRTLSFAALFALLSVIQPAGYRHSYPTVHDRIGFANAFGHNAATRLFYGEPRDLLSVSGYTAWRAGGILVLFAGMWGVFAAVRALRAEEEAGRQELLLAGILSRRAAFTAVVAALAVDVAGLWLATWLGLLAGGLAAGGSAFLALTVISVAAVFVAAGALASQVAPTRRVATGIASLLLGAAFLARVVADTAGGAGWVRWATPLGWAEEMRAFTGARPGVLVLPAIATVAGLAAAGRLGLRRDIGAGLIAGRDRAPARLRLLGSVAALGVRAERTAIVAWMLGSGASAFVLGAVSGDVGSGIPVQLRRRLAELGVGDIATPSGYLGFGFLFFILMVSLFWCAHVAAMRREEDSGQLETMLALPVSRAGWLAARLALGVAGAVSIGLVAGVMSWAGAASQDAGVSLAKMLEAGLNCLPTALLFGGIGTLLLAVVPRAAPGIAYGVVGGTFAWELVGGLIGAPGWLLGVSPFHHAGRVPAQDFKLVGTLVMLALAGAAAGAAAAIFRARDLTGA